MRLYCDISKFVQITNNAKYKPRKNFLLYSSFTQFTGEHQKNPSYTVLCTEPNTLYMKIPPGDKRKITWLCMTLY